MHGPLNVKRYNWLRRVTRMNNMMPKIMLNYVWSKWAKMTWKSNEGPKQVYKSLTRDG